MAQVLQRSRSLRVGFSQLGSLYTFFRWELMYTSGAPTTAELAQSLGWPFDTNQTCNNQQLTACFQLISRATFTHQR
jgi:hypothetical protein